jgi:hypothetical protein
MHGIVAFNDGRMMRPGLRITAVLFLGTCVIGTTGGVTGSGQRGYLDEASLSAIDRYHSSNSDEEYNRNNVAISDDKIDTAGCRDGLAAPGSKVSEFNYEEIFSGFSTDALLDRRSNRELPRQSQAILIADSGLSKINVPPMEYIFHGDVSSRDMAKRDHKYRDHGTQVASVALGGFDFAIANSYLLNTQTLLQMVNIFNDQPSLKDGKIEYVLNETYLTQAIREASKTGAIINISHQFSAKIASVEDAKRSRAILIVVAAGNNGEDLRGPKRVWPAQSGGQDNESIITVAALEQSGQLAPFSNWSPEHVDIGALGCFVRTWKYDEDKNLSTEARVSGTSFAAPAVTAVAVWLKKLYPLFSAIELKHRIIAGADISERSSDLGKKIRWGRILNVAKTLRSLRADVIEVRDKNGSKKLYTGRLISDSNSSLILGGKKYERSDLRKVAMIGPKEYVVFRLRAGGDDDFAEPDIIDRLFKATSIKLTDGITGKDIDIETNEIRDITFAHRPYWLSD